MHLRLESVCKQMSRLLQGALESSNNLFVIVVSGLSSQLKEARERISRLLRKILTSDSLRPYSLPAAHDLDERVTLSDRV